MKFAPLGLILAGLIGLAVIFPPIILVYLIFAGIAWADLN